MRVGEHTTLPKGLLDCPATELHRLLGGPALVHLPGERGPALFVSVLLHGNEVSGWNGLRRLLREHARLPRAVSIFIGNVEAAALGLRSLPRQQDFNRVWRDAHGVEAQMAASVLASLRERGLFAAVDLHNNTGHNPHYGVVTDLDAGNLGLAYSFSDKAVYIREPDTVLTRVFAGRCPAVALELGPVGDPRCEERCYDYLARLLALDEVPPAPLENLSLFRTLVRIHVAADVDFAFAGDGSEDRALVLTGGLEGINFHELPPGASFGRTTRPLSEVLCALDVDHRNVTDAYFAVEAGDIKVRQSVIPAMYTTDPQVIRQDCLCYFMERMDETDRANSRQQMANS